MVIINTCDALTLISNTRVVYCPPSVGRTSLIFERIPAAIGVPYYLFALTEVSKVGMAISALRTSGLQFFIFVVENPLRIIVYLLDDQDVLRAELQLIDRLLAAVFEKLAVQEDLVVARNIRLAAAQQLFQ